MNDEPRNSDIDYLDVMVDLWKIKEALKGKTDKELVEVLNKLPQRIKFEQPLGPMLRRFFLSAELCDSDREFVESCHLLIHTKYLLEE